MEPETIQNGMLEYLTELEPGQPIEPFEAVRTRTAGRQ